MGGGGGGGSDELNSIPARARLLIAVNGPILLQEDITHFGEFSDRPIDLLHDPPYESDASRWDFYF